MLRDKRFYTRAFSNKPRALDTAILYTIVVTTIDMIVLIPRGKNRSICEPEAKSDEIAAGMNGETIPIVAMKHRIMFSRLH